MVTSLDKDILEYLSVSKQKTEYLLSKYFSKNKIATVSDPEKDPNKLWSKGLKKWGSLWLEREYSLRNNKDNT